MKEIFMRYLIILFCLCLCGCEQEILIVQIQDPERARINEIKREMRLQEQALIEYMEESCEP